MEVYRSYFECSLGLLEITATNDHVVSVLFWEERAGEENKNELTEKCEKQLREYFSGTRKNFDLPLSPAGTDFQKQVWKNLLDIPFGKTVSYLDIALILGDKNATRAVGSANGQNPIGIIIPCHRVIGSDGKLTGYAGGLWRKEWLLNFENPNAFPKQTNLFEQLINQ